MIPMKTLTPYVMSDDMALGFYDADGSVLLVTDFRTFPSGRKTLSYRVVYAIGQSQSKSALVVKFAKKFNGIKCIGRKTGEFRANRRSTVGKRFCQFLAKTPPKHPYRRRDWLIAEEVILLLGAKPRAPLALANRSTRVRQITIAYLIKEKSKFLNEEGANEYFQKCCNHIQATPSEIEQGKAAAQPLIDKIEKAMTTFNQTLPTLQLSDDYVLGAHYGDGSFYMALSWKPILKRDGSQKHRLRCEPEWAISGDDERYCQSFANRFDGRISRVDQAGQKKFVLRSQKKCVTIISLFENAPWMPKYKKEQFYRWKESLVLLNRQEHFTEQGIRKLLDLTYGLAEKGGRPYSKDQYLQWGLAWLNDPNRQKRKPRGEKKS